MMPPASKFSKTVGSGAVFPELFGRWVAANPDAPALCWPDGSLTYAELNERANRLARLLVAGGAGPERVVALALPRGLQLIVAMLAVFKAGAAYMSLDVRYPPERTRLMLDETRPVLLVSVSGYGEALPESSWYGDPVVLDAPKVAQHLEGLSGRDLTDADRLRPLLPQSPAYVAYTSGSTGVPKGVVVTHTGTAALAASSANRLRITAGSRVLQFAPPSFDALFWEVCMGLLTGATLVVESSTPEPTGVGIAALCARMSVTHLFLGPALLSLLHSDDLPSVRTLAVGGEACPQVLVDTWAPGRLMVNAYGPTETTVLATISGAQQASVPVTVGTAVDENHCYLLDERLALVADGEVGELYVAGPAVARGYLNRPAPTAERFVACPFGEPGERMYRTGDLMRRLANGDLVYEGRVDDQIKIRGCRIEPGEVETALARHPDVAQAVLVTHGVTGDKRLVAYFTRHAGSAPLSSADLRGLVGEALPAFMVPSIVVEVDEMPLTPSGKFDRRALAGRPLPRAVRSVTGPRNEVERRVTEVWERVLDVARADIDDDFFDVGGTSLHAAKLCNALAPALGINVRYVGSLVRTLMSRRDLASLAAEAATLLALQAGSVDDEAGVRREVPDFAAESVLEAAVRFPPRRSAFPAHGSPSASGGVVPPRSVLLTGATGFLGAHLVRELLDQTSASIHCLARAQDDAHAQRRVLDAVRGYGLPLTEADEARIIGVTGDLGADRFGLTPSRFGELAASTDVVLHNGAWVNFLYPYSTLRQVNVGGTREIIRFSAAGSSIPVHYVSTQAVFTSLGVKGMRRVEEHTVPAHPELLFMGYAETKSVSETLLRQAAQRGMSLSIYRPHDVTGHSVTGRWNPESFLFKLLRSFVDLGAAPDFRLPLDFVPVDVVASTIVALVTGLPAVGSAFHLSNPDHPLLPDLVSRFNEAGHKIESLPLEKWTDLLIGHCARHEDTPLAPFASLFTERWGPERLTLAEFYLEGRMPEQSSTLTWEAARRAGGPPGPPPADVLLESCVQEITQPQR